MTTVQTGRRSVCFGFSTEAGRQNHVVTVTPSDHLYIAVTEDDEVTILLSVSEVRLVLRVNSCSCKMISGTHSVEVRTRIQAKHEEAIVVVMEVERSGSPPRHVRVC